MDSEITKSQGEFGQRKENRNYLSGNVNMGAL